jgi:hypothetical protein
LGQCESDGIALDIGIEEGEAPEHAHVFNHLTQPQSIQFLLLVLRFFWCPLVLDLGYPVYIDILIRVDRLACLGFITENQPWLSTGWATFCSEQT